MSDDPPGAVLRPWTIKAMPEELTAKVVAMARRRQETVADVVTRALYRELNGQTFPAGSALEVIPAANPPALARPDIPPPDICRLIEAAVLFSAAADKMPRAMRAAIARRIRHEVEPRPDAPP